MGNKLFSSIANTRIRRSVFNRSCGHKTTADASFLIPIFLDEVLPGDSFKMEANFFARINTLIVPLMDNLYLESFFFFVPSRLLWDNWEDFITGVDDVLTIPTITIPPEAAAASHSIFDYFGIPLGKYATVNALPFRAYNLIYNEWFRDQNLVDELKVEKGNIDDYLNYSLQRVCKRHDYFTSALPWPQKGTPVEIGLADYAPVVGNGEPMGLMDGAGYTYSLVGRDRSSAGITGNVELSNIINGNLPQNDTSPEYPHTDAVFGLSTDANNSNVIADLSDATAVTINELRLAFQLQKMLERDARGGSRYVEQLLTHFGVVSPDFRLQRPEFLGGSSQIINVNVVPQTSATDSTTDSTPQGNLAAYSTVFDKTIFNKTFVEHGYVIGLVCLRQEYLYQYGVERLFNRRTRYDFYFPALAHLGEQAILNKEIYLQGNSQDDDVFGYQERWAEYRYKPSRVSGLFRSEAPQTLHYWHLAEEFNSLPLLNDEFILDTTYHQLDRCIAVPSQPQLLIDSWFNLKCARPMPVFSVPGLVDHF